MEDLKCLRGSRYMLILTTTSLLQSGLSLTMHEKFGYD